MQQAFALLIGVKPLLHRVVHLRQRGIGGAAKVNRLLLHLHAGLLHGELYRVPLDKGRGNAAAHGAQRVVKPLVKELAPGAQRSLQRQRGIEAQPRRIGTRQRRAQPRFRRLQVRPAGERGQRRGAGNGDMLTHIQRGRFIGVLSWRSVEQQRQRVAGDSPLLLEAQQLILTADDRLPRLQHIEQAHFPRSLPGLNLRQRLPGDIETRCLVSHLLIQQRNVPVELRGGINRRQDRRPVILFAGYRLPFALFADPRQLAPQIQLIAQGQ